jgi:hypothetical protein
LPLPFLDGVPGDLGVFGFSAVFGASGAFGAVGVFWVLDLVCFGVDTVLTLSAFAVTGVFGLVFQ